MELHLRLLGIASRGGDGGRTLFATLLPSHKQQGANNHHAKSTDHLFSNMHHFTQ